MAGLILGGACMMTARANTFVTFSVDMGTNIANGTFTPGTSLIEARGTFNSWSGGFALVQQGTSTVYTNTFNDTSDANGTMVKYKFVQDNNYENITSGGNRSVKLPATSGASLILPTPIYNDSGAATDASVTFQVDLSQQIALNNFTPGTDQIVVRGNFNGWSGNGTVLTNNATLLRTNQYGLVTHNVYAGTYTITASPAAPQSFKYVIARSGGDNWDSPSAANQDDWNNRQFPTVTGSLPVVDFSDQPYAPLANLTFAVDMSAVLVSDPAFNPATVTVNGDFNGWTAGIACTNNPNAANTNIYTSAVIQSGAGSTINYQFRYNNAGTVYDHDSNGNNRQYNVPAVASTNLPAVYFNNININDLLTQDTVVTFTVDMNNAVSTDSHTFDPNNDNVYINGDFAGWVSWNPISLIGANLNLVNTPPGSSLYTFSHTYPKGSSRYTDYKYSINGSDNEAAAYQDHSRYIRSDNGTYNLPVDKFGTQYREPKVGAITMGNVLAHKSQLSWLNYPGLFLQTATSLNGPWTDVPATSGQSSTNWPVGNATTFFRLRLP